MKYKKKPNDPSKLLSIIEAANIITTILQLDNAVLVLRDGSTIKNPQYKARYREEGDWQYPYEINKRQYNNRLMVSDSPSDKDIIGFKDNYHLKELDRIADYPLLCFSVKDGIVTAWIANGYGMRINCKNNNMIVSSMRYADNGRLITWQDLRKYTHSYRWPAKYRHYRTQATVLMVTPHDGICIKSAKDGSMEVGEFRRDWEVCDNPEWILIA